MSGFPSSIASFPLELLCEIFLGLRETQDSWQYEDDISWLSVAHVNRCWRRAAVGLPRFWAPIPVGRPKLAALTLRRVKNAPLLIRANLDTRNNEFIRMICESYKARIWKVDFCGKYDTTDQFLLKLLQVPNLKVLSLARPDVESMAATTCVLQPEYEPSFPFAFPIHDLQLEGYLLPWNSFVFPNLTCLKVRYLPEHLREGGVSFGLLHALSTMPNLQELVLEHALSPIQFDGMPLIRLPNTKYVKIRDNHDSLRQTSLLDLAPNTVVEICSDDLGLEDVDVYDIPTPDIIYNLIERQKYPAVVIHWEDDNVSVCGQDTRRNDCFIFRLYHDLFRRTVNHYALTFISRFLHLFAPEDVLCLEFRAVSDGGAKPWRTDWMEWRGLWRSLINFGCLRKLHISRSIPPFLLETLVFATFAEAGYAVQHPEHEWYVTDGTRREMLPALTDVEFEDLSCTSSLPNAVRLLSAIVWVRRRRGLKVSNITLRNCTGLPVSTTTFLQTMAECHIHSAKDPREQPEYDSDGNEEWMIGKTFMSCLARLKMWVPPLDSLVTKV